MREVEFHKIGGLNDALKIQVCDAPGPGGANHEYRIFGVDDDGAKMWNQYMSFQKGPILENGVNGVSNESLLAVVLDRLDGFDRGAYATPENFAAMQHVSWALEFLRNRTKGRIARGVEGTMTV